MKQLLCRCVCVCMGDQSNEDSRESFCILRNLNQNTLGLILHDCLSNLQAKSTMFVIVQESHLVNIFTFWEGTNDNAPNYVLLQGGRSTDEAHHGISVRSNLPRLPCSASLNSFINRSDGKKCSLGAENIHL